jgi:hypothetical protein
VVREKKMMAGTGVLNRSETCWKMEGAISSTLSEWRAVDEVCRYALYVPAIIVIRYYNNNNKSSLDMLRAYPWC